MTDEDRIRRIDAMMNWEEVHKKVVWELRKSDQSRLKEVFVRFFNKTERIYAQFDIELQDAYYRQMRVLKFIEGWNEKHKDNHSNVDVLQIVKNILSGD